MPQFYWRMPNPWTGKGNPYTRKEVIERLHETVKEGNAIIAAGAGTGISAQNVSEKFDSVNSSDMARGFFRSLNFHVPFRFWTLAKLILSFQRPPPFQKDIHSSTVLKEYKVQWLGLGIFSTHIETVDTTYLRSRPTIDAFSQSALSADDKGSSTYFSCDCISISCMRHVLKPVAPERNCRKRLRRNTPRFWV